MAIRKKCLENNLTIASNIKVKLKKTFTVKSSSNILMSSKI